MLAKPSLKIVSPTTVNRTVGPLRRPNAETRTREHLLPAEVEALMDATKGNRLPHRDATMILMAYRHGLRAAKSSTSAGSRSTSPPPPSPCAGSRRARQRPTRSAATRCGPCAGCSGRARAGRSYLSPSGGRLSPPRASQSSWSGPARGRAAFKAHPHMLRHACGYALANAGHDTRALQAYLGHKNIQHTVRYTELAPTRFKDFWR